MANALNFIIEHARTAGGEHRLNKALADFDFDSQRRLGRTRMLVRAGPALGLMGTLIPLSPALTGLANGNTATLSQNLRVAFSVTVIGLLIGAVAFGLSLSRDRLYGQDLSDLQYLAAVDQRSSMISVTPHSRNREDRAGDPLDGLVNLFDLGIVLSVAFLLAALSSLHLGGTITRRGLRATPVQQIQIKSGQTVAPLPKPGAANDRARHPGGGRLPPRQWPARLRPEPPRQASPLMGFLWHEVRTALPLIWASNGYILNIAWVTVRVALVSTAARAGHRPSDRSR